MQKENNNSIPIQSELSPAWQELLGYQPGPSSDVPAVPMTPLSDESALPTLESDPWSELLHAQGIEVVDLQKIQLHMSDQDLEQVLQVMQEEPDVNQKGIDRPRRLDHK